MDVVPVLVDHPVVHRPFHVDEEPDGGRQPGEARPSAPDGAGDGHDGDGDRRDAAEDLVGDRHLGVLHLLHRRVDARLVRLEPRLGELELALGRGDADLGGLQVGLQGGAQTVDVSHLGREPPAIVVHVGRIDEQFRGDAEQLEDQRPVIGEHFLVAGEVRHGVSS